MGGAERNARVSAHGTKRVAHVESRRMVATTRTGTATNPVARVGGRLRNWFVDTVSELRKVAWPDSNTTRNLTIVVIGISAAIGFLLGVMDSLLTALYKLLEKI
jgi:preprotein translocase SecE subunit